MDKTHQSAVVIIPPQEVWEPVQVIRRAHDRQFRRWMPHLTLLYPFAPKREFMAVLPELAQVGWATRPFELTLARFSSFRHGRESYTVWLEPDPKEAVVALHAALSKALPRFGDTGSFKGGFTPHLSVGQVEGAGRLKRLLRELERDWQPLSFTVGEISLISRKAPPNDRFQVDQRVSLGG
jgi:RNA 2',3'-cyclic 3'-phosphodiesterase